MRERRDMGERERELVEDIRRERRDKGERERAS